MIKISTLAILLFSFLALFLIIDTHAKEVAALKIKSRAIAGVTNK